MEDLQNKVDLRVKHFYHENPQYKLKAIKDSSCDISGIFLLWLMRKEFMLWMSLDAVVMTIFLGFEEPLSEVDWNSLEMAIVEPEIRTQLIFFSNVSDSLLIRNDLAFDSARKLNLNLYFYNVVRISVDNTFYIVDLNEPFLSKAYFLVKPEILQFHFVE
jgi:hypothetical protein